MQKRFHARRTETIRINDVPETRTATASNPLPPFNLVPIEMDFDDRDEACAWLDGQPQGEVVDAATGQLVYERSNGMPVYDVRVQEREAAHREALAKLKASFEYQRAEFVRALESDDDFEEGIRFLKTRMQSTGVLTAAVKLEIVVEYLRGMFQPKLESRPDGTKQMRYPDGSTSPVLTSATGVLMYSVECPGGGRKFFNAETHETM